MTEQRFAVGRGAAPGAQLRAAREAAGMSLDQVAQQLKLAPRQVKALEDQDFAHLPGRTFTRGFVRNYARLLNLDAGELLASLPDAGEAPALEAPALQSTGAIISELPATETRGPGFTRWLIPLVLVGCVVAAAAYEWYSGGLVASKEARSPLAPAAGSDGSEPGSAAPRSTAAAQVTNLPNPLETAKPEPAAPVPPAAESAPAATQAPTEAPSKATSTAPVAAPPAAAAPAAADAMTSPGAIAPQTAPAPAASVPAEPAAGAKRGAADVGGASLLLTYRGASWTRIRDRTGNLLISRTGPSGSQQSLRGVPPFEVTIGNANMVTLVYRGEPVDLAPFTSHNVARLRLS